MVTVAGNTIQLPSDGLNHSYLILYYFAVTPFTSGSIQVQLAGTAQDPDSEALGGYGLGTALSSAAYGCNYFFAVTQGSGQTLGLQVNGTFTATIEIWGIIQEMS